MGYSFVLFDVSMEIHHGKFTLGNGGHTRFVSWFLDLLNSNFRDAVVLPKTRVRQIFGRLEI